MLWALAASENLSAWRACVQVIALFMTLQAAQRSTSAQHSGEPASLWIRGCAYMIDAIVANTIGFIFAFIIRAPFASGGRVSDVDLESIFILICIVTVWLYYALMESSRNQATLGKLACGLVVTDIHGQRIGFGQASGRYFGMYISIMILGIGFFMCAWTETKQCLHDMLANCLVLKK